MHHVHLVVGEHVHEVLRPAFGGAGHVGVAREHVAAELHFVSLALPPLHPAQHLAAVVVRAGRGGDPDRAAGTEYVAFERQVWWSFLFAIGMSLSSMT